MMNKDQIGRSINPDFPHVYAPTTAATKLTFEDKTELVGYFQFIEKSKKLETENKYTFVEFGEKAQMYRATNDEKYLTIVDGNKLENVEYPSYSNVLLEQLKKIKNQTREDKKIDWPTYREQWKASVSELQHVIMEKWFKDLENKNLMTFSIIPVKRIEPNIGEYLTTVLEIELSDSKYIVLEPIGAITSEYNGRLDLYMRGNVYKKVGIYRKILEDGNNSWVFAKNYNITEHVILTKEILEGLISDWLK